MLARMPVKRSLLLALSIAGCTGAEADEHPVARRAADYRSDAVAATLDAAGRTVRTRGLEPDGDEWRGFVVDQATEVSEVSLRGGSCYVVLAAGSSALGELDLRVFDGEGDDVARDALAGGAAAVRFCPARTGTYYVALRSAAGSGLFAVRRFRGPAGLPMRLDDLFARADGTDG